MDPTELDFRLMRSKAIPAALLLVFGSPAFAHAISMSFGDLTLDGRLGHYELRMPLYEIQHIQDPERTLIEQVGFSSGGREARRLSQSCGPDSDRNFYVCKAEYEFAAPVDQLDVTCRLAAVSVPNHLHLLHVQTGGLRDEAVFDLVYTHAALRFHPPSRWELAVTQSAAGFARAIGGAVQALRPSLSGETVREVTAIADAIGATESFEEAMDVARRLHREATFKIAAQVLERVATADAAGRAFADLADAVIRGLAAASLDEVERIAGTLAGDVAVVALGKCGSAEMTATSDLDLMTLYRGADGGVSRDKQWSPETFFARFTHRLVAALSAPTAEGGLYTVDLQLRPSGTKGPVAVSLPAFEGYYATEAEVWELLALTRARVVWATSDEFRLAAQQAIETALRRPRQTRATAIEVAGMRELMRQERPPSGFWDMKLSEGGLVDIEFCAQFLQLIHAPGGGPLRQNTIEALGALKAAGAAQAQTLQPLAEAFRLQQNLSQLIKVALPEGADPSAEPKGLRNLMALAAKTARFSGVRKKVNAAREAARAAFWQMLATGA